MIWAFVLWIPMMLVVGFSFKKDIKQMHDYPLVALLLFMGFFFLEITDIQQVALVDEEFAETLVETPFMYGLVRLCGWAEIAIAAAQGIRAIIRQVKPAEQPPAPQYGAPVYTVPTYRSGPAPAQPNPAPAAVEVKLPSGMVVCPKCQTAQRSDRTVCYECGEPLKQ